MRHESNDRSLQDYLDGRLGAAERAAMEGRLREDGELARRLEQLREIQDALRGGSEELSPGFYTRAKLRFESSAGAEERVWFRLFSWETAGLAAAAVLAMALFLPHLLQQQELAPALAESEPASLGATARKNEAQAAAAPGVPSETVQTESQGRDESSAPTPGAASRDRVAQAEARLAERARAEPPDVETLPDPIATGGDRKTGLPSRPQERLPALEDAARGERFEADAVDARQALPPAPRAERYAPAPAREAGAATTEENAGLELPAKRATSALEERADALGRRRAAFGQVSAAVELPAGLLQPGAVREVVQREDWEAWLRETGNALTSLGGFDERKRLVLIGPRERPADCSTLEIVPLDEGYRLMLHPLEARDRPSTGCALVLPRDGRPVRVVDAGAGRNGEP